MNFLNQNPFLRVLLPFMLGIGFWLAGYSSSSQLVFISCLYAGCLLVWLLMVKRSHKFTKVLFGFLSQVFLLITGWGICQYHFQKEEPGHYSNYLSSEPEYYAGYISDLPAEKAKSVKAEVVLQEAKINGGWKSVTGKIIVYFQKSELAQGIEAGDKIVFSSALKEVQPPLNPNEFDYKSYLQRKNIFYTAYLKDGAWNSVPGREQLSFYGWSQKIRKYLLDTYKESGLQESEFAMVAALVLGYDDAIDQPLMNAYSHTGTLHVLSVSGLHVGVIYLMLGYLFAFMNKNKKLLWLKVFLILSVLWFFVLLSGFSAPAVRAALMFSLILIGKTLFENVETSNIVLVSAFVSLLYNPFWLADVGFQLSYVAVLGIIYLYPYFYNMLHFSSGILDKIWALCSVSIAAQIATLPITLYYFHQFPSLFLVTNLILIPVSTVVMYGGILILAFSKIAFVSKGLVWLTGLCIKFMNAAALFFDQLPFCVIDNIHLTLPNMLLMYVLIVLIFAAIEYRSYRFLVSSFALSFCMLCLSIFYDILAKDKKEILIYQSNETAAFGVFDGTHYTLITDTVPDNRFASTLRENKIMNDVVSQREIRLSNVSLILVGDKKILYCKEGTLLSEKLLKIIDPDKTWLTAKAVKRKKQRTHLCDKEDLIITGRHYKKEGCFDSAYFTQDKGAFVVSLQK